MVWEASGKSIMCLHQSIMVLHSLFRHFFSFTLSRFVFYSSSLFFSIHREVALVIEFLVLFFHSLSPLVSFSEAKWLNTPNLTQRNATTEERRREKKIETLYKSTLDHIKASPFTKCRRCLSSCFLVFLHTANLGWCGTLLFRVVGIASRNQWAHRTNGRVKKSSARITK